ncbi:hypothetical protein Tco_0873374 [Tanacetum coccineum]
MSTQTLHVYPLWLCPHRLYKLLVKSMIYHDPGFEQECRQADEKKFWRIFDAGLYEECRKKYGVKKTEKEIQEAEQAS